MEKRKKKILIVEDARPLLRILSDELTHAGFDVITSWNGEEGLLLAEKEKPDLILLDIILPKMDGMTLLHQLRKKSFGKKIPVVLLTNLSDPQTMREAAIDGVPPEDFLIKVEWQMSGIVKKVKQKLTS